LPESKDKADRAHSDSKEVPAKGITEASSAGVGVSDFLADEIGALDSMLPRDGKHRGPETGPGNDDDSKRKT
jgi:hypothetical protein